MKITIEHYGAKYTTELDHDDVCLPEVVQMISGLLRAAGFSFDGELDIVDHSQD